jgi:hypothetical protein
MLSRVSPGSFVLLANNCLTCIAAVERAGLKPEDVEEVFVGNVLSAK